MFFIKWMDPVNYTGYADLKPMYFLLIWIQLSNGFVMYYLQHERPCCIGRYKLEPKVRNCKCLNSQMFEIAKKGK